MSGSHHFGFFGLDFGCFCCCQFGCLLLVAKKLVVVEETASLSNEDENQRRKVKVREEGFRFFLKISYKNRCLIFINVKGHTAVTQKHKNGATRRIERTTRRVEQQEEAGWQEEEEAAEGDIIYHPMMGRRLVCRCLSSLVRPPQPG